MQVRDFPYIHEVWIKQGKKTQRVIVLEGHLFNKDSAVSYKARVTDLKDSGYVKQEQNQCQN